MAEHDGICKFANKDAKIGHNVDVLMMRTDGFSHLWFLSASAVISSHADGDLSALSAFSLGHMTI